MLENTNTRRTVLKSAGGTLAFGGVLSGRVRGDSKSKIVTLRSDDGIEETKQVPTKWLRQNQHARKQCQQLSSKLNNTPGVVTVSTKRSDERIEGRRKSRIEVRINSDKLRGKIPDTAEGVPVDVSEDVEVSKLGGTEDNCQPKDDFDSMPGGVHIKGSEYSGTSGYHLEKDGTEYMVTAAHLWNSCSETIDDGSHTAGQSGRYLGEVKSSNTALDLALVGDGSPSIDFDGQIYELDSRIDVKGWVTETGLEDYKSLDIDIYKKGLTTGRTVGEITATNKSGGPSCIDLQNNGVETTANSGEGDSGGPTYFINDKGNAFLVNHSTFGINWFGQKDCGGNKIYEKSAGLASYVLHRDNYKFP